MKTRVLLADDHSLVAEGLRAILENVVEVVGTVRDGRALLAAVEELEPDVIVTDISMPLLNGIEAALQIQKSHPRCKIVFLTMHTEGSYVSRALAAGASGYVLKHSAPSELLTAIQEAFCGGIYVSPAIAWSTAQSSPNAPCESESELSKLSSRQREVLQLVAEGYCAKEAAWLLHVSPRTVEFHKYRMMQDLDLHSTAELTRFAMKHGVAASSVVRP